MLGGIAEGGLVTDEIVVCRVGATGVRAQPPVAITVHN